MSGAGAIPSGSGRELSNPPSDGISNIRFSNHSDHLLVSSWDKSVRLYDASKNLLKGEFMHGGPVLDCCFHDDSSGFSASADCTVRRYAFKCHRKSEAGRDTVYPVNAIAFHPIYGTFATGGCDGYVNVWDGNNKKRLYQYSKYPSSVAALSFSKDGRLLAVASSYTFEEGDITHEPDAIFVRNVNEVEVKPKPKALPAAP